MAGSASYTSRVHTSSYPCTRQEGNNPQAPNDNKWRENDHPQVPIEKQLATARSSDHAGRDRRSSARQATQEAHQSRRRSTNWLLGSDRRWWGGQASLCPTLPDVQLLPMVVCGVTASGGKAKWFSLPNATLPQPNGKVSRHNRSGVTKEYCKHLEQRHEREWHEKTCNEKNKGKGVFWEYDETVKTTELW